MAMGAVYVQTPNPAKATHVLVFHLVFRFMFSAHEDIRGNMVYLPFQYDI